MKTLIVAEYREGNLLDSIYESYSFAKIFSDEIICFAVGSESALPEFDKTIKLYFSGIDRSGEYNPDVHKNLLKTVIDKESPDIIVMPHSSYGWDLAPRLSALLKAPMISEAIGYQDNKFVKPVCNNKLRLVLTTDKKPLIVTLQSGAAQGEKGSVKPDMIKLDESYETRYNFIGYEEAEKKDVDLTKAQIIVSAGRGVGKKENIAIVETLAQALGGELGSSRPVVDAGWLPHSRQVVTTGQTVAPKLYVACGISGAIQHLACMKKAEKVIAINTDKDAPIAEVADLLVVADLTQFIPVLVDSLKK